MNRQELSVVEHHGPVSCYHDKGQTANVLFKQTKDLERNVWTGGLTEGHLTVNMRVMTGYCWSSAVRCI